MERLGIESPLLHLIKSMQTSLINVDWVVAVVERIETLQFYHFQLNFNKIV